MRWLAQFIFLCLMLLFGVFFGIDRAEQNMQAIQGTQGAERVFEVSSPEEGKMAVSVLGKAYETVQPIEEEQIEQSRNFLSHLGNKTGEALQWVARKVLNRSFELIDQLAP